MGKHRQAGTDVPAYELSDSEGQTFTVTHPDESGLALVLELEQMRYDEIVAFADKAYAAESTPEDASARYTKIVSDWHRTVMAQ